MHGTGVAPSSTLGRYERLFRLGAGGMAEVYVARMRGEAGFERLVAIKQMLPDLAEDRRFVDMFLDEARVAAHIHSAHVVPTLDLGRTSTNEPYIVMELVLGVALSTLLTRAAKREEALSVDIVAEIIGQAARGLHDAHEAKTAAGIPLGIVHRDVSPRNVLVGHEGTVRITDFGVARAIAQRSITLPGQVKGTFAYLSPEQAAGRATDRRADVFALGVVAWEALAGRRLFRGRTAQETLEQVRSLPIDDIRVHRPDCPDGIAAAVNRALERDPDARYGTALELAFALREDRVASADPRAAVAMLVDALAGPDIAAMRERLGVASDVGLEGGGVTSEVRFASSSGSSDRTPPIATETLPPVDVASPIEAEATRRDVRPPSGYHAVDITPDDKTGPSPLYSEPTVLKPVPTQIVAQPQIVSAPEATPSRIPALAAAVAIGIALATFATWWSMRDDAPSATGTMTPVSARSAPPVTSHGSIEVPVAEPSPAPEPAEVVPAVAPVAEAESAAQPEPPTASEDPAATRPRAVRPNARPTRARSESRHGLMGLDAFDDQARARP